MSAFRVWAPTPKKVQFQCDGEVFAMRQELGGWWSVEMAGFQNDSDYGFLLDDEGPFPDPRSLYQPDGVNGLSRSINHDAFKWEDAKWQAPPLSAAIIYELHIGTFTPAGTFEAAIEKLDHLMKLGITHVELMPVNEFSGDHGWGYDGVDLFAPQHTYGAPEQLKRLVNECHKRRLAVLLDVVYNHFGPSGNHLGKFGPYFTKKYLSPWGEAVNFDGAGSHEVRRYFCDNALMWLRDYHFDGLRLDAVHAIIDTSAEHFLEQLSREVNELKSTIGRNLVLIAESDLNDPKLLRPVEKGGYGLDAQWSDDFHHALHTLLTEEREGYYKDFGSMADLAKALKQAYVYDGQFSPHRCRHHGRSPKGLQGNQFLGYLQNHDQVGNRAKGDRSSRFMTVGRLKIGAALVLTAPFIPMLFQGEEWGATTPFQYFTSHSDLKLGEAVRQGRRREFAAFGWDPDEIPDPQARETFERSKLNWSEATTGSHADILNWHTRLIHLRQSHSALTDGNFDSTEVKFDEAARWLIVKRGSIVVGCNFENRPQKIPFAEPLQLLLGSAADITLEKGAIHLPAESVVIAKL